MHEKGPLAPVHVQVRARARRTVGVLGGMGPFAGVSFLRTLMETAREQHGARRNEEFPRVVFVSVPVVDAVTSVAGLPVIEPELAAAAKTVAAAGASFLVVPCNTVHALGATLAAEAGVPLVSIVTTAVRALASEGRRNVGLLATSTALAAGVYRDVLARENMAWVGLDPPFQARLEDVVLRGIHGSVTAADATTIDACGASLVARGADVVLLACTELSLLDVDAGAMGAPVVDSLGVLAAAACDEIYRDGV